VITISTGTDSNRSNYPPSEWLEDWPLPVLVDDENSSVARRFGLNAYPFLVVVDPDGVVAGRLAGVLAPSDFEQIVAFYTG